ncbi:nuclear transport factor 2 family protein [Massilia soli]|uniref:Nuclear transport factor 2 family protein n=1 Tax=Massilia soli TaxID=2792854 RepID=A0ABS7SSA9_9BURK|nr:nuclear transport factor 2 family protein [Massilia soli]MBZ2208837.1 nuclear transport factor 2 family protein [Massilia soli]
MNRSPELARLVRFYEAINPATLHEELASVYATDAHFKDPFNDVKGHGAIAHIFTHMFHQVNQPSFHVISGIQQDGEAFLTWEFRFRMKRYRTDEQCIRGATHILFDERGLVTLHRDYWDAAEELYEKLPLLGAFMRMLKRAAAR